MRGNKYKAVVGLDVRERILLQRSHPDIVAQSAKDSSKQKTTNEPAKEKRSKKRKKKTLQPPSNPPSDRIKTKQNKIEDDPPPRKRAKHSESTPAIPPKVTIEKPSLHSELMLRMRASRFRMINELLYTSDSGSAEELFLNDPEAFRSYHEGYSSQMARWPVSPVDLIIRDLRRRPKNSVVADMGCGEARIAECLQGRMKVHSFDLVAVNERVQACDIKKVPLEDSSVDVCVFCLSLMGTNAHEFLLEANRVLRRGGLLKIAEISSRIDSVKRFRRSVEKMGFEHIRQEEPNDMFVLIDFTKTKDMWRKRDSVVWLELKPCLYKKR